MTDKTMIEKLQAPLSMEDIEARIGTCSAKGFSLLLYKTARADMNRLDDVCGGGWCNSHYVDSKGSVICKIGVLFENNWVYREDTGSESMTEKEKGAYSDSFKRAGFRWGIGRELYNSPFIWISYPTEGTEFKDKFGKARIKYTPKKLFPGDIKITGYKVDNGEVKVRVNVKKECLFDNR